MKLAIAVFVLALATPVFAQTDASPVKPSSATPTGEGDPNVITCRPPQVLPNSRLRGPEICKTNAVWARYRKDGMEVAADGIHDVHSEKWRSINPQACHPATMGSGNTIAMMQANISMICE